MQLLYEKALSNYRQATEAGVKLKKPSLTAIRAAFKLHATPYFDVDNLIVEADRNFRTAINSLNTIEGGQAIEGIVTAVAGWVELLRELFVEPPESCKEATARIIQKRLTFPINFAGQKRYASDAFTWLYELGFQKDCAISVPVRSGDHSYEILRRFGVRLFLKLKRLRAELDTRKPKGTFEERVAKLQRHPDASWRKVYEGAPAAFYGSNWIKDSPQMEDYREAVRGRVFPTHQAKGKGAKNPMVRDTENRLSDIAETLM